MSNSWPSYCSFLPELRLFAPLTPASCSQNPSQPTYFTSSLHPLFSSSSPLSFTLTVFVLRSPLFWNASPTPFHSFFGFPIHTTATHRRHSLSHRTHHKPAYASFFPVAVHHEIPPTCRPGFRRPGDRPKHAVASRPRFVVYPFKWFDYYASDLTRTHC